MSRSEVEDSVVAPVTAAAARGSTFVDKMLAWVLGAGLLVLLVVQLPTYSWQAATAPKLLVFRSMVTLLLWLLGAVALLQRRRPLWVPWFAVLGVVFLAWAALAAALGANARASVFGMVFRYEGLLGFVGYLTVFVAARRVASFRPIPGRTVVIVGGVAVALLGFLALLQQVWPAARPLLALALVAAERSYATLGNPIY
ncbi:MAG: hypothetical protein M1337_06240, partial [Actinobacteria bacterium]|nr:hypothetical protein [Actinomycetota bacterium]